MCILYINNCILKMDLKSKFNATKLTYSLNAPYSHNTNKICNKS